MVGHNLKERVLIEKKHAEADANLAGVGKFLTGEVEKKVQEFEKEVDQKQREIQNKLEMAVLKKTIGAKDIVALRKKAKGFEDPTAMKEEKELGPYKYPDDKSDQGNLEMKELILC